jgi:hypothetical protein
MPWTSLFPEPIILKDGRAIATLGHSRNLILDLSVRHQVRPYWQYTAELLLDAAEHKGSLDDAYHQMTRALRTEGLL